MRDKFLLETNLASLPVHTLARLLELFMLLFFCPLFAALYSKHATGALLGKAGVQSELVFFPMDGPQALVTIPVPHLDRKFAPSSIGQEKIDMWIIIFYGCLC